MERTTSGRQNLPHSVISLDFAPTFLELAGGKVAEKDDFDGVNLIPYLTGQNMGKPHKTLNWRFTISAAIQNEK